MHFADIKEAEPAEQAEGAEGPADTAVEKKPRVTTSTIAVAGLIVAALGGLYLMHARGGPAVAEATDGVQVVDTRNVVTMQARLSDTEKVVEQFKQFPAAAQVPLDDLQRNPFGEVQQAGKPAAAAYDNRQHDREAAMARAQKLQPQLQSILFGQSQRSCMFAGKFYGEGDTLDGFAVQRITPDSVILKQDGFRFEIKLQR